MTTTTATTTITRSTNMSARTRWTAATVGLLVANVLAMVILMFVASDDASSKVLPSYKGVVEKR